MVPGKTILTADNAYLGGTTISSGTLQLGSGATPARSPEPSSTTAPSPSIVLTTLLSVERLAGMVQSSKKEAEKPSCPTIKPTLVAPSSPVAPSNSGMTAPCVILKLEAMGMAT